MRQTSVAVLACLFVRGYVWRVSYRTPEDDDFDGGNPYAEGSTIPPRKDFDFSGRGWEWWFGIIAAGIAYGLFAWLRSRGG